MLSEFIKLWLLLKDKKANDLKSICKQFNIKGFTGCKKDEIAWNILQHCATNLIFRVNEIVANTVPSKQKNKASETEPPIPKLSLIEELQQQRLEIENKMKEEIIKKQKADEELRREEEQKNN